MFKKLLASAGIGGAKVDTLVKCSEIVPGSLLPIEVVIEGGTTAQRISGLNLALVTRVKTEIDDAEVYRNHVLQSWQVAHEMEIAAGEQQCFEMELALHPETPLTALNCANNQSRVWLQTGLEIDMALDADDQDPLQIVPSAPMAAVMQAAQQCGLRLVKADVELGQLSGPDFSSSLGCYQELEYRPEGWLTSLNEVEISFVPGQGVLHLLVEVDRRFRGDAYIALTFPDHVSAAEVEAVLRHRLGL